MGEFEVSRSPQCFSRAIALVIAVATTSIVHTRDSVSTRLRGQTAHTFGAEIFRSLHVVHGVQGLSLLSGESLLIVELARAAEAVEKNPSRGCVLEEVDKNEDDAYQDGGTERRQQADYDAVEGVGRRS